MGCQQRKRSKSGKKNAPKMEIQMMMKIHLLDRIEYSLVAFPFVVLSEIVRLN